VPRLTSPQRLRFGEFLADNIVRFINLFTYLLTYLPYIYYCHLLLLSPEVDTHYTIPQRVEDGVDLGGWLRTEMVCLPSRQSVTHPSTTDPGVD